MSQILDFLLHLDDKVYELIQQYGPQTYAILFFIVFAETGFVIFPFLPGDSLLFAVGVFCRNPKGDASLNIYAVVLLLTLAAICGDQVNYRLGKLFGPRAFKNEGSRFFKPSNLHKTQEFFERYGPKTVTIARFVPLVRSFAPFVAGMGQMPYGQFCMYSVLGAFLWVTVCAGAGYLVGKAVGDKFEYAVLALITISLMPVLIEYLRHRRRKKAGADEPKPKG
jgi:membrane-associated protein